jgi:hypothetical protein
MLAIELDWLTGYNSVVVIEANFLIANMQCLSSHLQTIMHCYIRNSRGETAKSKLKIPKQGVDIAIYQEYTQKTG